MSSGLKASEHSGFVSNMAMIVIMGITSFEMIVSYFHAGVGIDLSILEIFFEVPVDDLREETS